MTIVNSFLLRRKVSGGRRLCHSEGYIMINWPHSSSSLSTRFMPLPQILHSASIIVNSLESSTSECLILRVNARLCVWQSQIYSVDEENRLEIIQAYVNRTFQRIISILRAARLMVVLLYGVALGLDGTKY